MNALLFAMVDAVLYGERQLHRRARWQWRFPPRDAVMVHAATEDIRAATLALGAWRSLWGVL